MNVLKAEPVPAAQAKELLEKRQKEGELNYEQAAALEHCEKTVSMTSKNAAEIIDRLLEKNKKLLPETAVKLVDVRPKTPGTVKAILLKDRVELGDDEINEIIKLLG